MAPHSHALSDPSGVNGQSQDEISQPWYEKNGREEYRAWQKAHPLNHIAYEKWKTSKYVDGISLYYATLGIFEESDTSDDELEQSDSKRRARNNPGSAAREPKTLTHSNGIGPSRKNGSATPLSADQNELDTSGKKKRKPRKKPKSSEVIASEVDSDEVETAATPSAPAITASGNRKSAARKPRKKPLSQEIISPEDEEDDPMAIDDTAPMAIASPLPVRSAPNSAKVSKISEPPKKHILKLYTKKTPKKKALSEETVHDDTDDEKPNAAAAATSSTTQTVLNADSHRDITAALERHLTADGDSNTSPAPDSESRKGLRTRRPAQQKPYSLDALAYDIQGDTNDFPDIQAISPARRSRRASAISVPQMYEEPPLQMLDEEALAILRGGLDPGPEHEMERRRSTKPKHFKGKGRAWKKDESDEDMEFNPSKKKAAAKAKEKVPKPPPPGKKRGRPRKSTTVLPEDTFKEGSDSDAASKMDDSSLLDTPTAHVVTIPAKKPRRVARKSALSEELVQDDSDDEEQEQQTDMIFEEDATMADAPVPLPEGTAIPAKKRGRPRKSDQSTTSNTIAETPQVQVEEKTSPAPGSKTASSPSTSSEEAPPNSSPALEDKQAKPSSFTNEPAMAEEIAAEPTNVGKVKTEPKKASVETDDEDEEL